jgi:hypothetical protein
LGICKAALNHTGFDRLRHLQVQNGKESLPAVVFCTMRGNLLKLLYYFANGGWWHGINVKHKHLHHYNTAPVEKKACKTKDSVVTCLK